MAFFSKTNVMSKFCKKLAVVWAKTPIFSPIFWRKYFRNHNIGPLGGPMLPFCQYFFFKWEQYTGALL
jgi:hypothetical protein